MKATYEQDVGVTRQIASVLSYFLNAGWLLRGAHANGRKAVRRLSVSRLLLVKGEYFL